MDHHNRKSDKRVQVMQNDDDSPQDERWRCIIKWTQETSGRSKEEGVVNQEDSSKERQSQHHERIFSFISFMPSYSLDGRHRKLKEETSKGN